MVESQRSSTLFGKSFDIKPLFISILITIICTIVFLLPSGARNLLKSKNAIFNPFAYVTASFVHDAFGHLVLNLFAFVGAVFILYYLNKKANTSKFFLVSLPLIFIALPILTYSLMYHYGIYGQIEYSFGLSIVDSALIGFFVPSLILYLQNRIEKFNSLLFFTSMFFLTLSFVSFLYSLYLQFAGSLIVGCLFGILDARRIGKFLNQQMGNSKNFLEVFVLTFSFFFYFFSIFGLFPLTVAVGEDSMIGIIPHLIGLLLGILLFSTYAIPKAITLQKKNSKRSLV